MKTDRLMDREIYRQMREIQQVQGHKGSKSLLSTQPQAWPMFTWEPASRVPCRIAQALQPRNTPTNTTGGPCAGDSPTQRRNKRGSRRRGMEGCHRVPCPRRRIPRLGHCPLRPLARLLPWHKKTIWQRVFSYCQWQPHSHRFLRYSLTLSPHFKIFK